jgi:hypothetical protein
MLYGTRKIMIDSLDKFYREHEFVFVDLSSDQMPLQQRLEWFDNTEKVFEGRFPPHERNPDRKELRETISRPSPYKIFVLGREIDGKKQVAALAILYFDEECGVVNLEYLSKDPEITIPYQERTVRIAGGYILRKAVEYARTHSNCNTLMLECELPSVAGKGGTLVTMDPYKRIEWYAKQGLKIIPVDDAKIKTIGDETIQPFCYMGLSLKGNGHPDYNAIAAFIEQADNHNRDSITQKSTLNNLAILATNPEYLPPNLKPEMYDLIQIVRKWQSLSPGPVLTSNRLPLNFMLASQAIEPQKWGRG